MVQSPTAFLSSPSAFLPSCSLNCGQTGLTALPGTHPVRHGVCPLGMVCAPATTGPGIFPFASIGQPFPHPGAVFSCVSTGQQCTGDLGRVGDPMQDSKACSYAFWLPWPPHLQDPCPPVRRPLVLLVRKNKKYTLWLISGIIFINISIMLVRIFCHLSTKKVILHQHSCFRVSHFTVQIVLWEGTWPRWDRGFGSCSSGLRSDFPRLDVATGTHPGRGCTPRKRELWPEPLLPLWIWCYFGFEKKSPNEKIMP